MSKCNLCPRKCNIDRNAAAGVCMVKSEPVVARAALHMWEEPCISGKEGSGTIFFAGCNLKCVYCQNYKISRDNSGTVVTVDRLAGMMLELEEKSANNINLVTPTHYADKIIRAIDLARKRGLGIPIVYNTSSYENVDTLKMLEGYVDVYLPDFKYYDNDIARKYSNAYDYRETATRAVDEMVRQHGEAEFDERGMMTKGVIVRHMILPGHTSDSKKIIKHLYDRYKDGIYFSIMNQYTPTENAKAYPEINRKVTQREYDKVVDYAIGLGIERGFIQEGDTASESFIPDFDLAR